MINNSNGNLESEMRGASLVWMQLQNHQLVICNIKQRIETNTKLNMTTGYHVSKLTGGTTAKKYQYIIGGRCRLLLDHPGTHLDINSRPTWDKIKEAFNNSAKRMFGTKKNNRKKALISQEVKRAARPNKSNQDQVHLSEQRNPKETKGHKDKINSQDLCNEVDNAHQTATSKEGCATIENMTKSTTTKCSLFRLRWEIVIELTDVKERWKQNRKDLYSEQNPTNEEAVESLPVNSLND